MESIGEVIVPVEIARSVAFRDSLYSLSDKMCMIEIDILWLHHVTCEFRTKVQQVQS